MAFITVILKNYSIGQALRAELEEDVGFLVRSLPGILGFALRYLAYKLLFGKIVSMPFIYPGVRFVFMKNIRLGRGVLINSFTYVYGRGGIEIGDKTLISPGCSIVAGRHEISADKSILEHASQGERIVIEGGCWIGANCTILGGVRLAKGTVVGAGSVVTRSTEPNGVYVGSPARKIRDRTPEDASLC